MKIFDGITGGKGADRDLKLKWGLDRRNLTVDDVDICECSDENTGRRYGEAKCRKGWAWKIGSGGRNKGSAYAYQVWAVVKPSKRREENGK